MLTRRFSVVTVALLISSLTAPAALAAPARTGSATGSISGTLDSDFRSAWQITRGKGVTIAVLSSAVDDTVQPLAGAVTMGPDYVGGSKAADWVGTVTASLIAGRGPTAKAPSATLGFAPDAHILAIRVSPDPGDPRWRHFYFGYHGQHVLAKAIRYAVTHGASVIYTEGWSDSTVSPDLQSAAMYALAKGAVLVSSVATSDAASATAFYVPGFPGAIEVSPVELNGQPMKKFSSAIGTALIAAPGTAIPVTGPGGQQWDVWGGAVAEAKVAATAALIKAAYPRLPPALVARSIAMSARRHPAHGFSASIGFGILNPAGALAAAGRLVKLSATASPSQGAVSASWHFGGGPPPTINAVQHSFTRLAGFSLAAAAGLASLLLAVVLAIRRRRRTRLALPRASN